MEEKVEIMETEVSSEETVLEIEGEENLTEEAVETTETVGATEEATGISIEFDPSGFTRNADKMGLGMLGIFVVIGIIIIATSLLAKIKSKDAE